MTLVIPGVLVAIKSFKGKSFSRQIQTQKREMTQACYTREHLQKTEIYTTLDVT